ncbi:MAG: hypothetical protein ACYSU5_09025 [Planctomycetota bacterium]|jgi:hypothetical protein
MRIQNNTILTLVSIMFLPALIMAPTEAFAACDQPDAPDCPCFDDSNAWDPSGAFIQDVAIQTVGTKESCLSNGGKPYYQMVLGCNNEDCALVKAWLLSLTDVIIPIIDVRQAWCSEAISYWHRETGIPYSGGYRNCDWYCNWLNYNVGDLKRWYKTEEDEGGRGRWIDPCEVDYENYVLGVTLPVPGSYVSWQTYDDFNDTWVYDGLSHSLMINEMWLHKDIHSDLFQVEITLLEGNSGNQVKNTRHWDDVLSLTPQGSEWIPNSTNKKIYGFGVDLNSRGEPIYDKSRLHLVPWLFVKAPPQYDPVMTSDPMWEQHYEPYIPALKTYAKLVRQAGGEPNVTPSTPGLPLSGIPDGNEVNWLFPKELPGGEEVLIDLLDVHPLPIIGIQLSWDSSALPGKYRVQFATPGQQYQDAIVPDLPDPGQLPSGTSIPIPAIFNRSATGVQVRYVKLIFPSTFEQDAVLQELRFRYEQGPMADSEVCPFRIMGDLDFNCRVDLHDVALMAGSWLVDCYLTPQNPACVPE